MREPKIVVLEATGVMYFSRFDEAAFFEWLDKLKCVSKYYGELHTLYIEVQVSAVDATQLDELLGLFFRYHIDMKQLAIFDRKKFAKWFRNRDAYWYDAVFGTTPETPPSET